MAGRWVHALSQLCTEAALSALRVVTEQRVWDSDCCQCLIENINQVCCSKIQCYLLKQAQSVLYNVAFSEFEIGYFGVEYY